MFKVVLWDYTGESADWAKKFLKKDVEIIRTLRPNDADQAEVIMRGDWNFVLIFENGQREIFNEIFKTMREMNFSTDNIIFAKDFNNLLGNPAAIYALLRPELCDNFYRRWSFSNHRRWHHYAAVTAGSLNYLGTSADDYVTRLMYVIRDYNFSQREIDLFYKLVKKYYNVDDSGGGIFLDLGANIGTTGIYFLKKLTPDLKLIAFEPDAENFKLLRINTILNDMEDKITLVNCGLGENFDEMTMYINSVNPGANSVIKFYDDKKVETVKIIPLDYYLAENKIAAEDVKYIWIDTEGFEAQVILGAKNLLKKNPAPIFMEFNPLAWNKTGCFERFVDLLKTVGYTHFIHDLDIFQRNEEKLYPIDKLLDWKNYDAGFGGKGGYLGNIFLVKIR